MKIVYCIPGTFNSGGMERVLAQKANYLADTLKWDVTIITSSQKGRQPFYDYSSHIRMIDLEINYDDIKALPIAKRIYQRIKANKLHKQKLKNALINLKPDFTISMFTHEMSFLYKIKDGSKKILELHFSKNFRHLDAISNSRPMLFRYINRILDIINHRVINYYDKFVVLTHRDAQDWGYHYKNIQVISNPCSYSPSETTDSNCKKVLAVGRLCAQKGFDILIDVWNLLPKELRNAWHLDIVGSGPDEQILKNRISEYNLDEFISVIPARKDVENLYLSHSIFCFPSRYEGFGLSLLEAMSFGLAPIANNCPCGPSEIIENGVNGFLIEEIGSSIDFSNKLRILMQDYELRDKMGRKSQNFILTKYSTEAIMAQWVKLFNELKIR